ncbi:MAG: hypothetical protein JO091_08360, partial [Acidobacteriaceae bacterium]|nr:hypothetical protein [Acidobacteriaceae bacterium]
MSAAVFASQTETSLWGASFAENGALSPVVQTALYSITASDLKGDLSFLASDALQGRYTPSFGLDVAAEFIAAQFRAAGLEPAGDQEYFQTASMIDRRMPRAQSDMLVRNGSETITIPAQSIAVWDASQPVKIDNAPIVVFAGKDPDALKNVDLTGKAILLSGAPLSRGPREPSSGGGRKARAFDKAIASSNAALEVVVGPQRPQSNDKLLSASDTQEHHVP